MRRVTNTNLLLWVNLPKSHNGALLSRKCSIKVPAKWKKKCLDGDCHQRSKWFLPYKHIKNRIAALFQEDSPYAYSGCYTT